MNEKQLKIILEDHIEWLNSEGAKGEKRADLRGADLRGANLSCADLRDANLSGADLSGAKNLEYVNYDALTANFALICPEKGSFTAFKKLKNNIIAELFIPAKARRSSATTRKCRASEAKVVKMWNYITQEIVTRATSVYDSSFDYETGKSNDETIADLRKENEQLKSDHDLLINDFRTETENLRKQIKVESDARKRFLNENKQLKQQLAEKEELLKNAIVPKFKIGQEVYFIEIEEGYYEEIVKGRISEFTIYRDGGINYFISCDDDFFHIVYFGTANKNETSLFATKEEAQQKLKELEELR